MTRHTNWYRVWPTVFPALGLLSVIYGLRQVDDPALRCASLALAIVIAIAIASAPRRVTAPVILAAFCLVVAGPPLWNDVTELREITPNVETSGIRVLRDGTEVEISGTLTPKLAQEFQTTLQHNASVRVVQIDSSGGNLRAARFIERAIQAAKLDTFVGDICQTACVIAFMGGKRRLIGPFARIGLAGKADGIVMRDSYERSGVPATLLPSGSFWATDEVTYQPISDLLASHLATGSASADEFALAGFGPAPTQQSIRARLLSVPLYHALADTDPKGFDEDLAFWDDAVLRGEPGTIAFQRTRSRIDAVFHDRLPNASGPLLHAHATLMSEELRLAAARGLPGCVDLVTVLLPGDDQEEIDLALRRADLKVQVILTALPVMTTAAPFPNQWPDGIDPTHLASALKDAGPTALVCKDLLALYEAASSLPDDQSTPMLQQLAAIR